MGEGADDKSDLVSISASLIPDLALRRGQSVSACVCNKYFSPK